MISESKSALILLTRLDWLSNFCILLLLTKKEGSIRREIPTTFLYRKMD